MKAKIVRIGNSRGIRLPKLVIEQVGLAEEVEMEVREGEIVISPAERLRSGWSEAARALAAQGEDQLLDEPTPTSFDQEDWEW
ncbi:MAG: AbrB/MazE/SpoVT family DNA-binding domain-containing protein [bacterium]|nr:AbrB/MazE/SpoVT family DNA-binding domain-containing protein [bacterium]